MSEKREGERFFSSSIGVSVQGRPVFKSTSISLFHIVLLPSCMRKRDSEQPRTVHLSLGPTSSGKSRNLSKFPRDYEKSKHRCLYLLYMTKHCLHNWFIQIWSYQISINKWEYKVWTIFSKKFLFTFGVLKYISKGQFLSGACLVWFLTVILGLAVFHKGFW